MISKKDLNDLFVWAKNANVPLKTGPTAEGYSNKPINFCWLKKDMKSVAIRKSVIKYSNIISIFENTDILFAMISIFDSGTKLNPHKDPNVYSQPYKRIQIPLEIPNKDKCYMVWRGEKIHWTEGEPQVFEVMDVVHEGYNNSDHPMKFLFVDVKKNCIIE
jgi:hypothetical protein